MRAIGAWGIAFAALAVACSDGSASPGTRVDAGAGGNAGAGTAGSGTAGTSGSGGAGAAAGAGASAGGMGGASAAGGASSGGASSGGANSGGANSGGANSGGANSGGTAGAVTGGAPGTGGAGGGAGACGPEPMPQPGGLCPWKCEAGRTCSCLQWPQSARDCQASCEPKCEGSCCRLVEGAFGPDSICVCDDLPDSECQTTFIANYCTNIVPDATVCRRVAECPPPP